MQKSGSNGQDDNSRYGKHQFGGDNNWQYKKKNLLEYVDTNEFYSIKGISNDNTFMNVDKIKNKTWYDFKCSYLEFYQLPKNKPINVYEIFICNAIIYDANAVCTKIIYIC